MVIKWSLTCPPGGISGIGLAAVKIFATRGAHVFALDRNAPQEPLPQGVKFIQCDQTSWNDLRSAFQHVGKVDIVVANAGISEVENYFDDTFDEQGHLLEPSRAVIDVNLVGTLNFCKWAISCMRRQGTGGSVVIVSSATAYSPEHSLPVYSACKLAVRGNTTISISVCQNILANEIHLLAACGSCESLAFRHPERRHYHQYCRSCRHHHTSTPTTSRRTDNRSWTAC